MAASASVAFSSAELLSDIIRCWFLAGPESQYSPSTFSESTRYTAVPSPVRQKFPGPKCLVVGRQLSTLAVGVLMPEAAIYENGYSTMLKHDVWLSRQILHVSTVSESKVVNGATEFPLGPCIPPVDSGHDVRTLGLREYVSHAPAVTVFQEHCSRVSRRRASSARPMCFASGGGTALPICFATSIFGPRNTKSSGNACRRAASL